MLKLQSSINFQPEIVRYAYKMKLSTVYAETHQNNMFRKGGFESRFEILALPWPLVIWVTCLVPALRLHLFPSDSTDTEFQIRYVQVNPTPCLNSLTVIFS